MNKMTEEIIPLGTATEYGTVEAIHSKNGERSYFCIKDGVASLIPAELMEVNYADRRTKESD